MKVTDHLEQAAVLAKTDDGRCGERYLTAIETFQLSQAVSLKRIADAVTGGLDANQFGGLTNLAWEMGRSFEAGRRTDR